MKVSLSLYSAIRPLAYLLALLPLCVVETSLAANNTTQLTTETTLEATIAADDATQTHSDVSQPPPPVAHTG